MLKQKLTKLLSKIRNSALPAAMLFLIFVLPMASGQDVEKELPKPRVLAEQSPLRGEPAEEKSDPLPYKVAEIDLTKVSAQSILVYDKKTSTLLMQRQPDQTLGVASLTKLLTALVVYEKIDLNEYLVVNPQDLLNVSPSLNLKIGDSIKALDLFNSMLIGSCNDAALMLANHTAEITGDDFETLMNSAAQSLGMHSSHFNNPMGFDSVGNFSTASDMRLLVEATQKLEAFTVEGRKKTYSFTSVKGNAYRTTATNKLIAQDPEISGIKTGYTEQTGGSMITTADHLGNTIVILILGSKNREADTKYIKEKIFESFAWSAESQVQ